MRVGLCAGSRNHKKQKRLIQLAVVQMSHIMETRAELLFFLRCKTSRTIVSDRIVILVSQRFDVSWSLDPEFGARAVPCHAPPSRARAGTKTDRD